MFVIIIFGLIFFAALSIYLGIVRPLLDAQPALSAAFKAEASFADRLRAKLVGWRTRIAARLTMIIGLFVGFYDQALPYITGQDWTPLTAKLPAWALPVGMVGIGLLFAWLRKMTDDPPLLITQKDDAGVAKVVDLVKPDGSSATSQAV
jgi:hypothetical protein